MEKQIEKCTIDGQECELKECTKCEKYANWVARFYEELEEQAKENGKR